MDRVVMSSPAVLPPPCSQRHIWQNLLKGMDTVTRVARIQLLGCLEVTRVRV